MGGESRLCYHGVPRILHDSLPEELLKAAAESEASTFVRQHI